jgi:hypothetical protein
MYEEDQLERSCDKRSITRSRGLNILKTINRRNADCIGHILHRNRLLIDVVDVRIDRRIAVRGRRRIRHKQLLDDLKEKMDTGN